MKKIKKFDEEVPPQNETCHREWVNVPQKIIVKKINEIIDYVQPNKDNPYKQAWEELYEEREMPCCVQYMQELEEKYNFGDE